MAIHRARQGFVKSRTAQANQIRGLLAEYGITIPEGISHIATHLPEILVHGWLGPKGFPEGMPLGILQKNNLSGVLKLLEKISKVIEETRTERVARKIDRSPAMLGEIAKFFTDWPQNYYGLLTQLHEKTQQQSTSIPVSLPVLLKKLFGSYPGKLLLVGELLAPEQLEFLEGAYFFSPSENSANEQSVLRTEVGDDGSEYSTISNLASHLNVHKATVKNWAKSGVHGLSLAGGESLEKRFLVKLNPDFPKKTSARCLTPRLASKYIGIPESVLIKLRADGYYQSNYFSRFPGDFQANDLDSLDREFVRMAPEVLPVLPEGCITFDRI
ncbi:MAG: transposase, partial [Pseudomonadota bacterium]